MQIKWLIFIILIAGILLSGCSNEDVVTMPTGLFMPHADVDTTALCSITLTDVQVVNQGTPPKASLILQGSVGAYCGQLEIKMSPIKSSDEVRIIVVAETPKDAPTSTELQTSKPVFVNMTLDTLPTGRYKLYINGKKYETFSTP